jgi:hypothetical protein
LTPPSIVVAKAPLRLSIFYRIGGEYANDAQDFSEAGKNLRNQLTEYRQVSTEIQGQEKDERRG